MPDPTNPPVPANHSLTNIFGDPQRTVLGIALAGVAIALVTGYLTKEQAIAAVGFLQGVHYVTT